jgi:hypothetical protein
MARHTTRKARQTESKRAMSHKDVRPPHRARALRAARALIGWLPPEMAHSMLAGAQIDGIADAADVTRAKAARERAAGRSPVDQAGIVGGPPRGINEHLAELRIGLANFFNEGWRVCTVELPLLYSLQPTVFVDYAAETVAAAEATDTRSLASVTLPLSVDVELAMAHDPAQRAWTVSTRNLNLRVMGPLKPTMNSDGCSLGYIVSAPNSVLQVGHFEGRFFCRDGHHRAYQLLRRGISQVPALIRDFESFGDLAPAASLLPEAVLRGEKPPTLTDFLDDEVSADVQLPATRKAVVVTAAEVEFPV